jgi:tetratricopeptide (TPR) repeat protein
MNPTRDVREKPRALAAVLFALCLLPMTTLALPPAVETDRLLLQAKTALDKADALSRDAASSNRDQALKEQYALAASAFEKAEALGTKLPSSVPYHHGVALAGIGKLAQARELLGKYLEQGTGTKFYTDALAKYNQIEADMQARQEAYAKAQRDYREALSTYEQRVVDCVDRLAAAQERLYRQRDRANEIADNCESRNPGGCAKEINAALDKQADVENKGHQTTADMNRVCKQRYEQPSPPVAPAD